MPFLVLIGFVVLVALWVMTTYNRLVSLRNQVQNGWRQIDVQLKRRHDLIPNLVNTVKGSMEFERDTLTAVMDARARAMAAAGPADSGKKEGELTQAVGRLFAVAENYPQLKSNENFLRLQDELAGTENRIAVERRKYNETLQRYNTSIELFPNNIVAGMSGFTRNDAYFKTEPGARTAPKVQF
jgi:LemA protein